MDLRLVNLDLVKFKDLPRTYINKEDKCLEYRGELYVISLAWYLNYTTLEGPHENTIIKTWRISDMDCTKCYVKAICLSTQKNAALLRKSPVQATGCQPAFWSCTLTLVDPFLTYFIRNFCIFLFFILTEKMLKCS